MSILFLWVIKDLPLSRDEYTLALTINRIGLEHTVTLRAELP